MAQAAWQAQLRSAAGARIATFTDQEILGLHIKKDVYGVGMYDLSLDATVDTRGDLFEVDGQVEIWRRPPGEAWYLEFEGLHQNARWVMDRDGKETFTSFGVDYKDILARRVVSAYAGSPQARKAGVAETVLKQYVTENCIVEHVVNGGFESGDPPASWAGTNAVLASYAGSTHSGLAAMSVAVTADNGYGGQTIDVLTDTAYMTFSGWSLRSAAGHQTRFRVYDVDNAAYIYEGVFADNAAWTQDTTAFAIPAGCTQVIVECAVETNGETGYFDDVSLTVLGADLDDAIPELSIEADGAGGNAVSISRPYRNLLEVCQEIIAQNGEGAFDIVSVGDALWELRWYDVQRGTDRTASVLFATGYGNMVNPVLDEKVSTGNVVLVIGSGVESHRDWETRPAAAAPTGMDRRKVVRDARDEDEVAVYQARGDALLFERKADNFLRFDVLQTATSQYGVHYFLGDKVSARYRDTDFVQKIVGVDITLAKPDVIRLEFEDV